MLLALNHLRCETRHVVVAPGCDGETKHEDFLRDCERLNEENKFLGWFPLDDLLPTLARWAPLLEPTRTPNIILDAFAGKLRKSGDHDLIVPRGSHPAIPKVWLTKAFVFAM